MVIQKIQIKNHNEITISCQGGFNKIKNKCWQECGANDYTTF